MTPVEAITRKSVVFFGILVIGILLLIGVAVIAMLKDERKEK